MTEEIGTTRCEGTEVTDKVTLIRRLGEGAMGEVWLASHATLKTEVAVKFIAEEVFRHRPDAATRFTREATAAAQISSPHVVQMFDHGVMADGTPYIVMEFLKGESLHERLEQEPLSIEDTEVVLTQIARALTIAHSVGVVHRDIKPHNIFLVEPHDEPFVKLLDFGIAKRLETGDELTEPGTIVGTPQYVSRDLVMHGVHHQVDEQVDLWSMGVVAYKCLTQTLPFDGDSIPLICAALARGIFDPPSKHRPGLPEAYDRWFLRVFHPDTVQRFGSARQLADSFKALRGSTAFPVSAPPSASSKPRLEEAKPKRHRWLMLAAFVFVAIAVMQTRQPSDEPKPPAPASASAVTANTAASPTATSSASGAHVLGSASAVATAPSPPTSAAPAIVPRKNEVAVPAGHVWRPCREGDTSCTQGQSSGQKLEVGAFFIGRFEVPVVDYARCFAAGGCDERRLMGHSAPGGAFVKSQKCNWKRPHRAMHPLNCVSHSQAQSYCAWVGGRLPTELEWERAARGEDRRAYPWGDQPASCVFAVMAEEGDDGCGHAMTWRVGKKLKDVSPFGAFDMAGNVREWVADPFGSQAPQRDAEPLDAEPAPPARGSRGPLRTTRGGSWGNAVGRFLQISTRDGLAANTRSPYVGFRCARSAAQATPGQPAQKTR